MSSLQASCLTAATTGAVAIIDVRGPLDTAPLAGILPLPAVGDVRLYSIPDLDDVLLARPTAEQLHVMPHGGVFVVERVLAWLAQHDVTITSSTAGHGFDALDEHEAAMLEALPRAQTQLAVDTLLAQRTAWQAFDGQWSQDDSMRSARLDRLLTPPLVVLAGRPNIGKSTLLNALAGRTRAIVGDQPGTTRDHVGAMLDLGGLVVEWIDTPGLRTSDDPIETAAIEAAMPVLQRADLLIAAADAHNDWPELLGRADLRVALRADLGARDDADCVTTAITEEGLDELVACVREALLPQSDLESTRPWRISDSQCLLDQSPIDE